VAYHVNDDGYNRLRLCRALAVVKGRLTVALAAFLRVSQAAIVAASGCLIPYPLIQPWRANTANSTSAISSQLPCLGGLAEIQLPQNAAGRRGCKGSIQRGRRNEGCGSAWMAAAGLWASCLWNGCCAR
jgi:hypothetical protein